MMIPDQEAKTGGQVAPETFAQLIDRRLGEMGITQMELEARSEISDSNWSRWRKGSLPSRLYVKLVAEALDVPAERLQVIVDEDRRRAAGVTIDTPTEAQAWIAKQDPTPVEQGG